MKQPWESEVSKQVYRELLDETMDSLGVSVLELREFIRRHQDDASAEAAHKNLDAIRNVFLTIERRSK